MSATPPTSGQVSLPNLAFTVAFCRLHRATQHRWFPTEAGRSIRGSVSGRYPVIPLLGLSVHRTDLVQRCAPPFQRRTSRTHINEVAVLEDVLHLMRRQQVFYVLRDAGRNAAPFTEALPDLNRIRGGLLFLQQKARVSKASETRRL